jgi:hypothetical protein
MIDVSTEKSCLDLGRQRITLFTRSAETTNDGYSASPHTQAWNMYELIKRSAAVILYVTLPVLLGMLAQPAVSDQSAAPLFTSDTPIQATLELPLRALRRHDRAEAELSGQFRYEMANGEVRALDVEVSTRGHSRLELCKLPPLKLDFQRKQLDGTLFEGQNRLKLVTHCKSSSSFYRYLEHEYALYRSYAALTDAAFRVRKLELTYHDTDGGREQTHPAFLIESDRELSARLGYAEIEVPVIANAELAPEPITLLGLFQFLAGNTDWSLRKGPGDAPCCHNGLLLQRPDGEYVIVPYDFDQAGLINAAYATPAPALGIRSVRQRLYRGLCTGEEHHAAAIDLLNQRRGLLEAEFPMEGKMQSSNRRALRYIDSFYDIINDSDKRQRWIDDSCRGAPSDWDRQLP